MAVDDVAAVIARARARGLMLRWCRNCQHRMLPPNQRSTDPDFVEIFATHGGYGLCRRCYSAARRPVAPPLPRCQGGCNRPMVTYRRGVLPPRGAVTYGGYMLCATCYARARQRGTLPNPAPLLRPQHPRRHRLDGPLGEAEVARDRRAVGLE